MQNNNCVYLFIYLSVRRYHLLNNKTLFYELTENIYCVERKHYKYVDESNKTVFPRSLTKQKNRRPTVKVIMLWHRSCTRI